MEKFSIKYENFIVLGVFKKNHQNGEKGIKTAKKAQKDKKSRKVQKRQKYTEKASENPS